jgi:2-polyprenyl-6-methoxyphenol hydroxylase-like FAD-dependent oxidoreductase
MPQKGAVVIGGSLAGLCAARVLAGFYERVTIVDRDSYPAGAFERAGVPQSRHVHALLARGRRELEGLFPGFDRLMLERGAHEINFGVDFAALRADGWAPREGDGIPLLFASRILLEATIRELLRTHHPNIELIERADVIGLVAAKTAPLRVTGVAIRLRDGGGQAELDGDLVVDASGRSSKAPAWFSELGLEPPAESVVDSFAAYASRWFQAPPFDQRQPGWWWRGIWIDPIEPDFLTAGVLFPVENDRWIVTLAGINHHYPPSDEAGFMALLPKLRSPIIAEAVKLATPISPVYSNRAMANRWRHYEKWSLRLDGFVALGDSACAFNPVYGQGMTSGAISSLILRDTLEQSAALDPELPRRFFVAQARFLRDPWGLATGADFRFESTVGKRPFGSRLLSPYFNAMFQTSLEDPRVNRQIGEVINMLRPPSAFFSPSFAARVIAKSMLRALRPKVGVLKDVPPLPPLAVSL